MNDFFESERPHDSKWPQSCFASGSCVLLFLCMAFPTAAKLVNLKSGLFALLLAAAGFDYLAVGRARLDPRIALWTLALTAMGFLYVLKGVLAGNPGAGAAVTVHILWPLAFTLWITGFAEDRILRHLHRTVILATLFIGLYGCAYVLTELNILPDIGVMAALSLGWDNQSFGSQEGLTKMAIAGMNSLPFLLPYVMASAAVRSSWSGRGLGWKILLWTACAAGGFTVLAGGRRALFLVVLLAPALILLARFFQPASEKAAVRGQMLRFATILVLAAVATFAALTALSGVDLRDLGDYFGSGFNLSAQTPDGDAVERRQELIALSRGWLQRPLLGAGLGASALGSIRSETTPWAYELCYLAILYQTGLFGFLAYAAGIAWIFWRGVKIVGEGGPLAELMIPMLVGFSALLIANATNPYLEKFDEMWTLFLPLAVINRGYRSKRLAGMKLAGRRRDV